MEPLLVITSPKDESILLEALFEALGVKYTLAEEGDYVTFYLAGENVETLAYKIADKTSLEIGGDLLRIMRIGAGSAIAKYGKVFYAVMRSEEEAEKVASLLKSATGAKVTRRGRRVYGGGEALEWMLEVTLNYRFVRRGVEKEVLALARKTLEPGRRRVRVARRLMLRLYKEFAIRVEGDYIEVPEGRIASYILSGMATDWENLEPVFLEHLGIKHVETAKLRLGHKTAPVDIYVVGEYREVGVARRVSLEDLRDFLDEELVEMIGVGKKGKLYIPDVVLDALLEAGVLERSLRPLE
ncbi:hypothetical protein [Thermofilum pendens]|uniref:DUF2110 family protein n=1 Tax=Thermofilum pendens (strain DSM 2475 / Hrk 5) TaxID=368408 RepID=A1S0K2_THEPD|nr:hypothetical protein [Thermofilum pendens]ABL78982.1 hypothetical protein Tpen_1587 [Thermofilum pendens Hrk 5]